MLKVVAWEWVAASMIAAWPIRHAERPGANRRCWAWHMNVRRWNDWRRPVGMYRYRARCLIKVGIWPGKLSCGHTTNPGRFNRGLFFKSMPRWLRLLLLSDLYRRIRLARPQTLGVARCHDTQAEQNNQYPQLIRLVIH